MDVKAIIFDYDGVIARTDPFHEYAVGKALGLSGFTIDHAAYMKYFFSRTLADGFAKYLQISGRDELLEELILTKKTFDSEYEGRITAYDDAVDFIAMVRGKYPLAIASGTRKILLSVGLKKFDLLDVFSAEVTAEDYERAKPAPDAFLTALRKLNERRKLPIESPNVMVIEDSPLGVRAAKNAHMICAAVTRAHSVAQFPDADIVVSDLRDIHLD